VNGGVSPLIPNALPVTDALEIVRLDPPVFVRVSVALLAFPIWTFPKFTIVGFADNVAGVRPVPDKLIFRVLFEALLVTTTFPVTAPAEVGANLTLKLVLCPADSVTGELIPLTPYPAPLAAT